ncbi:MAG: sugar transferase, partial [Nitrosomonadaceae bacterium]|nr:sugar transferase [Nitrosomonadaceae bacterium]
MLRIYNHYISSTVILLIVTEVLVLMAMFYVGTFLRFPDETSVSYETFSRFLPDASTFTLIMVLSMASIGMYQLETRPNIEAILIRLMPSLILGFGLMTLVFYVLPDLYFGRGILGIVMFLSLPGILVTRCALLRWLNLEILESRAVVLGTGAKAQECVDLLNIHPDRKGLKIV